MSSGAGAGSAVLGWVSISRDRRHRSTTSVMPVQPVGQPGGGDRGDRRGISEHEPDPRRRQRRVDRQISRPGLEHRQDRHDRLGRPRQQQRHTLPRAHPVAGQQVRQPVSRLVELRDTSSTRPRNSPPPPPGCAPPARRTTPESTPRAGRPGQHRPVTPPIQPGVLSRIQHIHRRQPPRRIGGHRHQHPLQPLDQRLDAGRVEHVGVEFDAKAQFVPRHALAPPAGSGCIRGW